MKKTPTIALTGGGSGGHIMPLLSLAHALKRAEPGCRIVYIGLRDEQLADDLKERFSVFDEVRSVPAGKFRRYHNESLLAHLIDVKTLLLNARDFFRTAAGIGYAWRILKKVKPDIVFSKGGFVAVPVGLAATLQKIPLVTHDSDSVPGLANRIIGRFAALHATGMPAQYYNYPKDSIHYVGVPIDERIRPVSSRLQEDFKKQIGLPSDSLVLLVGGAGLGARDINNMMLSIAPGLIELFSNLQIIHITGPAHEKEVAAQYSHSAVPDLKRVKVLGFTPEFYKYTGAADLIVTRAGATTIAELSAQRKAVVLIPAPHLTGGHQLKNAKLLQEHQAALVVDNNAAPEKVLEIVADALSDETARRTLADNLGKLAKSDAADKLAELLLSIAAKK